MARSPVVRRRDRGRVIARGDERTVDDPGPGRSRSAVRANRAASLRVMSATTRWACDFEIENTAASSRIVRFVRRAAQPTSSRKDSGRAHGRPRRDAAGRRHCRTASI